MAVLKVGAASKFTAAAVLESLIPVTHMVSQTLVPGDDQLVQGDPTAADIDFTLPDAASNAGVEFFIKRVVNGGNIVTAMPAGSDDIEGTSGGYILALVNEYIHVYSDGTTTWKIKNINIFAICTMQATAASFTVTTSLTKFTSWDTVVFSTPQKLVGSLANDRIDILQYQGPIADGYSNAVTFSFIYTNNNTVTAQLYVNGALVGIPVSVNALGSGKPTSLTFVLDVGVVTTGAVELHLMAENGGTMTAINALIRTVRIGH